MKEMMKEIRDVRKEVTEMRKEVTEMRKEVKELKETAEKRQVCMRECGNDCIDQLVSSTRSEVGSSSEERNGSAAQANRNHASEGQQSEPTLKRASASQPDAAQQATKRSCVSPGQTPSSGAEVKVEPSSPAQGSRTPAESRVTSNEGSSDRSDTASCPPADAVELVWTPLIAKLKIWDFESNKIKTDLVVDGIEFGLLTGGPRQFPAVRFFAGDRFVGCYPEESGPDGLPTKTGFSVLDSWHDVYEATQARVHIYTREIRTTQGKTSYDDGHRFYLSLEDAKKIESIPTLRNLA